MAELPKTYDPKDVEERLSKFWEEKNFFVADPASNKEPHCIVIPPPNVTGKLHIGHALVNTLIDVKNRQAKMAGKEALWVPGTDHAGIATQTVVERHLMASEGKRRRDYSREDFLKKVWEFKEQNEATILNQLRRLGASCDWSRLRFTMDAGNNHAVRKVFKKLYDEGIIYKGDYLVNWDPVTQTALADDEVEYEERDSFLWHLRYPLSDGSGEVTVATTRPETMLGDSAVAVHPDDVRYQNFIGKTIRLPLTGREVPVIADHYVDPSFGSGVVKITPAHDPNDYQVGMRHDLPLITMMTPDGKVTEDYPDFAGLSMEDGRKKVVEALESQGFLVKKEPHKNRVGISYRSKATIEPFLSKQWFVKMEQFKKPLRELVESETVKLLPKGWDNTYFHWIDNLRDWCISRQLWWGHRIPVWHKIDNPEERICFDGEGLPPEVEKAPEQWEQDPDVLDTWFSSGLFPFAALGWPEKTPLLDKFYPNTVLITAHDILFFWVARMLMMGTHVMKEAPFPKVFLHGLIYGKSYWRTIEGQVHYVPNEERIAYDLGKPTPPDVKSKWEKMSKSKGNIIDPIEMFDEYGTDAVRISLCSSCSSARQIDLDRRKFEEFRNFTNKVWNGARFIFMNLQSEEDPLTSEELAEGLDFETLRLEDRWILGTLAKQVEETTSQIESYHFDQAAMGSYEFYWKQFCAYYVEMAKPALYGKTTREDRKNKQKVLTIVLSQVLRLMHPIVPFITEELFGKLQALFNAKPAKDCDPLTAECIESLNSDACCVAAYPTKVVSAFDDQELFDAFELIEELIYTIRNIRGEMKLPPGAKIDLHLIGKESDPYLAKVRENKTILESLVKINSLNFAEKDLNGGFASSALLKSFKVVIPMPKELLAQEKSRLEKEKVKLEESIARIKAQLSNESFVEKAPAKLIEKQRNLLSEQENQLSELLEKEKALV